MYSQRKSKIIDSHCHVNSFDKNFQPYFENVDGMEIFEYGSDINMNLMSEMAQSGLWIAAGLHPLSACYEMKSDLESFLRQNMSILNAIGETGIDIFKANNYEEQMDLFNLHCMLAQEYNKPVVVHCRGNVNIDEILYALRNVCFVFHCFSYDLEVANRIASMGGYVSFSGMVTFDKLGHIQNAASQVPISAVLCETDSPYLSPVPVRGLRNVPQNVKYVYEKCALLRNMECDELIEQVKTNFCNFLQCRPSNKLI